jgi:hypothetical protein
MTNKPDLGAILEAYGLNVQERYGWVACKCVVHDDSHASAAYNLDKQQYNCLVCQLLGDVYDLVARKENIKEFKDVKRRAESLANGSNREVRRPHKSAGSVLPTGSRHKPTGGKFLPSWKRRGA